ncbi:MAG: selenide, water dikinase SelD [bacterium]
MGTEVKLTGLSRFCGCGAKLPLGALDDLLKTIELPVDRRVLVGLDSRDDAGVFKLNDDTALIFTTDIITPVANDAYSYGAIAAANALSDVYAMGGTPIMALNVLCFPYQTLDEDIALGILEGAGAKLKEANCALLGGHTLDDQELKFGQAIVGTVHPDRILANSGAKVGDLLVLTKPLGTGAAVKALKDGKRDEQFYAEAKRWMMTLNAKGAETALKHGAHAMTDITGFGVLGHAWNIARESEVAIEFDHLKVPILDGVMELLEAGDLSTALKNNWKFMEGHVKIGADISQAMVQLLNDPQTSGGLLIAVPEFSADALVRDLKPVYDHAAIIGRVASPGAGMSVG